jgi:azurin
MIRNRNRNKITPEKALKNVMFKGNWKWGLIVSLIVALLGTVTAGEATHHLDSEPRVIAITGNDQMKFDITEIEVKAGEKIKLILKNIGKIPKMGMAHNFVLLKSGVDAQNFSMAAIMARESEYIPKDREKEIIAYTGMAGPDETVTVEFTAPETPGKYDYVCTFPGHYLAGMKGVLIVN